MMADEATINKRVKSPWHCPNCGSTLVCKEGQYGKFMACPDYPQCQYTRALWTYQNIKPICKKCNGAGLLPFIKHGKIVPHAYLNCECTEKEPIEYHQPLPEDIDYPVSYNYYLGLCELHGWESPELYNKDVIIEPQSPIVITNIRRDEYEQLRLETNWLRKKLLEHLNISAEENDGL